jgi:hypothetical protein
MVSCLVSASTLFPPAHPSHLLLCRNTTTCLLRIYALSCCPLRPPLTMADSLERRDTLLITHDNFQQRQRQTVNVDSELLWRVERWVGDNITSVNDPAFQSVNQGPILEYMSECHRSTSTQVRKPEQQLKSKQQR